MKHHRPTRRRVATEPLFRREITTQPRVDQGTEGIMMDTTLHKFIEEVTAKCKRGKCVVSEYDPEAGERLRTKVSEKEMRLRILLTYRYLGTAQAAYQPNALSVKNCTVQVLHG